MNFELKKITLLIFTDIDGTLINNDTFFEGKNIEIAEILHEHNHILIYNSSKTFDEIVLISSTREPLGLLIFCLIGSIGGIFFNQFKENFLRILINEKKT